MIKKRVVRYLIEVVYGRTKLGRPEYMATVTAEELKVWADKKARQKLLNLIGMVSK